MIRVYDINVDNLEGKTLLTLEIEGLSNSKFSEPTESVKIHTITPDAEYLIDKKSFGLPIFLECNFPCGTCKPNQPSVCTSCNLKVSSEFPYYYENQCLASCPTSWYPFTMKEKNCRVCNANCFECAESRDKCTKCAPGSYLLGNSCLRKCPLNFYSNPVTNTC